jgi:hypothetical protein
VDRFFDTIIWATIATLPRYIFDKRLGVDELHPSEQERAQFFAGAGIALRNMYYSKLRQPPTTASENFKHYQQALAALELLKGKCGTLEIKSRNRYSLMYHRRRKYHTSSQNTHDVVEQH